MITIICFNCETIVKVELLEVHTLYEIAKGARLEGSHLRVAHATVRLKVARVVRLEQLLGHLDHFLFASYEQEKERERKIRDDQTKWNGCESMVAIKLESKNKRKLTFKKTVRESCCHI